MCSCFMCCFTFLVSTPIIKDMYFSIDPSTNYFNIRLCFSLLKTLCDLFIISRDITFFRGCADVHPAIPSESDNEADQSHESNSADEDPEVKKAIGMGVVIPEGVGPLPESDGEADFVLDDVVADPPPVLPPVVAPPIVDDDDEDELALEMAAPAWAPGVQCADVNTTGKKKCMYCGDQIMKGAIRLKFWQSKSVFRFMHHTCCNHIPEPRRIQSRACLRYQKDFGLVAHAEGVAIMAAIDEALLLIP